MERSRTTDADETGSDETGADGTGFVSLCGTDAVPWNNGHQRCRTTV
jgi:hypothetical protein